MVKINDPLKELRNCHTTLLKNIDMLEMSLKKFRKDRNIDDMFLSMDGFYLFFKSEAELHKRDEEEALFPFLDSMDSGKVVKDFIKEHGEIRMGVELLKTTREMKKESPEKIEREVSKVINMFRDHVKREEEIVFRFAEKGLKKEQLAKIADIMCSFRS